MKKRSSVIIEDNYMGLSEYERKGDNIFSLEPPEEDGFIP